MFYFYLNFVTFSRIFVGGNRDRRLWTVACIRLLGCVSRTGHTAELCLVNEATSLIRIRTLINSPAEFSSSSLRLERRSLPPYPSFPFTAEGRMVLAHPPPSRLLLRPTNLAEKERLRGKPVDHPLIHGTLSLVKRERIYLLPLLLTLPFVSHRNTVAPFLPPIYYFSPFLTSKREKINRSIFASISRKIIH